MADDTRNLGYLAWRNDLSWMESQKGTRWKKAIHDENTAFQNSLEGLKVSSYQKDLKTSQKSHPWIWRGWTIESVPFSPVSSWTHSSFQISCWSADLSESGTLFAAAVQDSHGLERFTVQIFSVGSKISHLQTIKSCGPHVAFQGETLFYLGSSKDLWYDSVHCWTHDEPIKQLYKLTEKTENLSLDKAEDKAVYVISSDYVKKRFGFVSSEGIKWKKQAKDIFVVSYFYQIFNQVSTFCQDPLESMSLKAGWAVTRSYGIRTVWDIRETPAKSMMTVWGEIHFDPRDPFRLSVCDMRYEPYVVQIKLRWTLSNPKAHPFPMTHDRYPFPTFLVYPEGSIRGLLVIAYGAYGSPTKMGHLVQQWRPLLLRGWVLATVCVPGSGDHDIAWKESGQHLHRKLAIDAFAEAVRTIQESLDVSPKETCLYGRSAGGLLVISAATLHPELVGALYVESPYVDVLRTMSNPELPLTQLETMEYGVGKNPIDFLATQTWSPMEHTPVEGIPGIFVVARSDTTDLEVFPYEILKWIWRIRSKKDKRKHLFIDEGKGHFATGLKSRAEDLALLDSWLNSPDKV